MGVTDRAKIQQEEETKRQAAQSQANIQLAQINAQKEQAIQQANIDIERQRQQGLISVAQAQALTDEYQAKVNAWANTEQEKIRQMYGAQREALNDQTKVGLEAIQQVGQTERMAIGWRTGLSALTIILIFLTGWILLRFRGGRQHQVVYMIGQQYPQLGGYHQLNQTRQHQIDAEQGIVRYEE